MSYLARQPETYVGKIVGTGQCVAFVQAIIAMAADGKHPRAGAATGNELMPVQLSGEIGVLDQVVGVGFFACERKRKSCNIGEPLQRFALERPMVRFASHHPSPPLKKSPCNIVPLVLEHEKTC